VGRSPLARLRHFLAIARTSDLTREIIVARCERGAQIASGLGFPITTSETIAHVDEHWCGLGHPAGLSGTEIPQLSRIVLVAQTFEAFNTEQGFATATAMIRDRRGSWFEPRLVDCILGWRGDNEWWRELGDARRTEAVVMELEPGDSPLLATDERLDAIAYAFASVIDAKTPFTWRHSTNVAAYATVLARALGRDQAAARDIMRAGLLHDIGKLGISNRILDKPGRLSEEERATVRQHPVWTWEILERVPAFHRFAWPAALHHERLDGKGYPWAVDASELDFSARALGVADVYEALTADRPYRKGMHPSEAIAIMMKDRGTAFDPELLDAAEELGLNGTFQRVADSEEEPFTAPF
jgi:putative nucleotidyltransferase with HDIG domain